MKILLTGASGFLGTIIRETLQDHEIITLGRKNSTINADITLNTFHIPLCDIVIHAAGKAHSIPKNEIEENEFFNVNVNGTVNLLKSLENSLFPKFFVFISSVAVYGLIEGFLVNENSPLSATDAYGRSKIEAEEIISKWCTQNNVILTILRLPLIAGPKPLGNLNSMIKGINNGYYFDVAGGHSKKSIVLAKDVAKIIIKAAETGGIYNLTDGYHPSFSELAKLIAMQLGKKRPMSIPYWMANILALTGDFLGPSFPLNSNKLKKITSKLTFDDTKAKNTFNWKPESVLNGFHIN